MKKIRMITFISALLAALVPTAAPAATTTPEDSTAVDPALTQVVEADENITPQGNPVEIAAGHLDLGPKLLDGQWTFMVRDDTSAEPRWRHLEDVVFRVSDEAKTEIPKDNPDYNFVKADGAVWAIPQNEIANVVWLGWSTQDPEVVKQLNGGVTISYSGHEGEGDVFVFVQAGNFSGPQLLWDSTKDEMQPIHVEANTHTHANWVFTTPGTHLMRLTVTAQLKDGSTVENSQVLRFAVGDAADAQAALETEWSTQNLPEEPADVAEPSAVDQSTNLPAYVGIGLLVVAVAVLVIALAARSRASKQREQARRAVESGQGESGSDAEARQ